MNDDYKKDRRVIARVAKNQWHVGTISAVKKKGVTVEFDDGLTALIEPEDYKDLFVFEGGARRITKVLNDNQANALRGVTPRRKPQPLVARPELVMVPPPVDATFRKAFKRMTTWLTVVARKYKLPESKLSLEQGRGSVGAVRTFDGESDTKLKWQRMVQELTQAFQRDKNWRVQTFTGSAQFFSTNGLYHAVFYDIPNPMHDDGKRQIGFYIKTAPEQKKV